MHVSLPHARSRLRHALSGPVSAYQSAAPSFAALSCSPLLLVSRRVQRAMSHAVTREQLQAAREHALAGEYATASVYYEGVAAAITKCVAGRGATFAVQRVCGCIKRR
jgi:hypothetical protein